MDKQQARVQEIGRATLGYRVYLNKLPAGYYWSDFPEHSEHDETGGLFEPTPLDALKTLLQASDFLRDSDGTILIKVYR